MVDGKKVKTTKKDKVQQALDKKKFAEDKEELKRLEKEDSEL